MRNGARSELEKVMAERDAALDELKALEGQDDSGDAQARIEELTAQINDLTARLNKANAELKKYKK